MIYLGCRAEALIVRFEKCSKSHAQSGGEGDDFNGLVQAHCLKKVTIRLKLSHPTPSLLLIASRYMSERADLVQRKGSFSCENCENWEIPLCMTFALILLLITILADGTLLLLLSVFNIRNDESALQYDSAVRPTRPSLLSQPPSVAVQEKCSMTEHIRSGRILKSKALELPVSRYTNKA